MLPALYSLRYRGDAYRAAAGLELLHAFALLQDEIAQAFAAVEQKLAAKAQ